MNIQKHINIINLYFITIILYFNVVKIKNYNKNIKFLIF